MSCFRKITYVSCFGNLLLLTSIQGHKTILFFPHNIHRFRYWEKSWCCRLFKAVSLNPTFLTAYFSLIGQLVKTFVIGLLLTRCGRKKSWFIDALWFSNDSESILYSNYIAMVWARMKQKWGGADLRCILVGRCHQLHSFTILRLSS